MSATDLAVVSVDTTITLNPTSSLYGSLSMMFEHFNAELFLCRLPLPMITLRAHAGSPGFYKPDRFRRVTDDGHTADEIALDPKQNDRPLPEVMATFVHQLVHHAQRHFAEDYGKASRAGYHDAQFAKGMAAIGLPVHNTANSRKNTGQHVDQTIVPGGTFDRACTDLLASGFTLPWMERPTPGRPGRAAGGSGRCLSVQTTRFRCPECLRDAIAELTMFLVCGTCNRAMEP